MCALPRFLGEGERLHRMRIERQRKFLGNLSNQGKRRIFMHFHFATGKFPEPAVMLTSRALLEQNTALAVLDRSGHHRLPCRTSFHLNLFRERIVNDDLRIPSTGKQIGGSIAMNFVRILQRLAHDTRGATVVEYGMILAGIFLVMAGALSALGDQQKGTFTAMAEAASGAMAGSV